MAKSYVYIIQSGPRKGSPIKIGVADNPESRMRELQTGNPETLVLIASIEQPNRMAAYDLESWLHRRFSSARISGEWFDSDRCGLKRAFKAWESIHSDSLKIKRSRVHSDKVKDLQEKVLSLQKQNERLNRKVKKLESDIEEYLDSEIARNSFI